MLAVVPSPLTGEPSHTERQSNQRAMRLATRTKGSEDAVVAHEKSQWHARPMSDVEYLIYSGSERVTNLARSITDLDRARSLARQISTDQPDASISVVSLKVENAGEWRRVVTRFVNGKEPWYVDFYGEAFDALARSEQVTYLGANTEIGPDGSLRQGLARHRVAVEAADEAQAIEAVQSALGQYAAGASEWHVKPLMETEWGDRAL